MALTVEERKKRRVAGIKKADQELTEAQRIRRILVNGRPPASELKTPAEAVSAARVLHRELETRMTELKPKPGDWAVSIGYVSPDFSFVGFTQPLEPSDPANPGSKEGNEGELLNMLTGHIVLGLLFAIADRGAKDTNDRIVTGVRPFLVTKQTGAWLEELEAAFRFDCDL